MKKNEAESFLFIDTRTLAEVNFVGIADVRGLVNIPYVTFPDSLDREYNAKKKVVKLVVNSEFAETVTAALKKKNLSKSAPVLLMCRSGNRSAKAANLLHDSGFKKVYNIVDGFEGDKDKKTGHRTVNGWKNSGLPWKYGFQRDQILTGFSE
ncbi:MAG: hypothetical protein LGR52_00710 [Candidatus Thiosymbion ectosymbiont of Robbea hypermnestra]|nr:hypothetical protein [Candidatus Thiosymbion ectosymbiont of Robbea hypermnestra]